ncbi:MAG: putative lipopolysaccharide heptosyltransferase III [Desulfobacca sp. RBG_16_60_12]|nr:MAG: putative lipopolysaccharide heptosyltransferase III [Desulfobacca sp. RBG_16_60_12]
MPAMPKSSDKRILVIKLKQPGDVLVSTPVIAALKAAWPGCRLTYLVPRGTEEMVSGHPGLDGLMVVDRRRATWVQAWRFIRDLRQQRFDLVLELSGGDRGAIYSRLTGARERLGLAHPRQPFWQRHVCFTRLLPRPKVSMHMVDQNLAAVRALGLEPVNPRLQFFWDDRVEQRVQTLLTSLGLAEKTFAVMHPGAGWRFKCWTPAGYARVIEFFEEQWGLPVVLTGTKAAHEQELLAAIHQECRAAPLDLTGRLSLKELGALISKARVFFGMDSAPMHLAAAVNTPAVALFGPSGVFNWGPWGEGHLVIKQDWDCLPCGKDGCEGSKVSRCLVELTPAEVLAQMARHFGELADKMHKTH